MVGIFKKKREDGESNLLSSHLNKVGQPIQLKDSEEEHSAAGASKMLFKRITTLSRFQRLDQTSSDDSVQEYAPPTGFVPDPPAQETTEATGSNKKLTTLFSLAPKTFQRLEDDESVEETFEDNEVTFRAATTTSAGYTTKKASAQVKSNTFGVKRAQHFHRVQTLASSSSSETPEYEPPNYKYEPPENYIKELEPTEETNGSDSFEKDEDSLHDTDSSEFRQFVFDDKFSTIKKITVASSDSGGGEDDIFRMAAVKTLSYQAVPERITVAQPTAKSPVTSKSNASQKNKAKPLFSSPILTRGESNKESRNTNPYESERVDRVMTMMSQSRSFNAANAFLQMDALERTTSSSDIFSDEFFSAIKERLPAPTQVVRSPVRQKHASPGRKQQNPKDNTANGQHQHRKNSLSGVESLVDGDYEDDFMVLRKQGLQSLTPQRMAFSKQGRVANERAPQGRDEHAGRKIGEQRVLNSSKQQLTEAAIAAIGLSRDKKRDFASDLSIMSTVSNAGATVRSKFPSEQKRFGNHLSAFSDMEDPFKIGAVDSSVWNRQKKAKAKPAVSGDDLIMSIRRAREREPRDPDTRSLKPDPSPRGVQQCSSDSFLETKSKGSRNRHHLSEDDIRPCCSDSALEEMVQKGKGPMGKAPSVVPANAILGSMLFRQMDSSESSPPTEKPSTATSPTRTSKIAQPQVPTTVLTEDSTSDVSSVTDAASSFYVNNLQSWKKQAQSVLDHYNVNNKMKYASPTIPSRSRGQHHHHSRAFATTNNNKNMK